MASGIRERADRQIRDFVVEAGQERVRRLPSQAELLQLLCREVAQVPSENDGSAGSDPGRDDMTIIRVWQVHFWDMVLVLADHRRRERVIHQPARVLQALDRNGWR